jgi:hypothetical protein
MKSKEHQQLDFSKTKGIQSQPNNQILWKINPIDQILHHFEVTIEYSREGAVQEISNKES